ncbi:MAG TPA: regulatory protein RecX [Casimicrobiaceae bacterium]|nr:regulatory protein RecX [Casimicrobiaceae bacterium]
MRDARDKPPPSARAAAIRMLARRDLSSAELQQRLRARGIAEASIAATLDEFERLGYLSDARYAQGIVEHRAGRFGKRAIARDLHDRRIAPAVAREALGALESRDELADAIALWSRRFGQAPRDDREKGRQIRFLMSRGYGAAIAFKVLRAAGASVDGDLE